MQKIETNLCILSFFLVSSLHLNAEINRFAIFLLCLLVPLGSMAPTETSESRVTTGQRQNSFTTEIPTYASIIQQKAHELFEFYVSAPFSMSVEKSLELL